MAELRTEIADFATRIEQAQLSLQREALALRTMHDALKKRCEDEIAGQYESDKLAAIEPKIAAFETGLEHATGAKKPAAATAHKTEHK